MGVYYSTINSENHEFEFTSAVATQTKPPIQVVMDEYCSMINSENHELQFTAAQHFRIMVAIKTNPPIQDVIDSGVVPRFIQILQDHTRPELQFEVASALKHIAGGSEDQTRVVVEMGCIPIFVDLLNSQNAQVVKEACWALRQICNGGADHKLAVIQSGAVAKIVRHLSHFNRDIQYASVTTIVTISYGDAAVKEACLRCGCLPYLKTLLSHSQKRIRLNSCRTIRNITAGNMRQIQEVLEEGIFELVIEMMTDDDIDIKARSVKIIRNTTIKGSREQMEYLVTKGCIESLCDLLACPDVNVIGKALDALDTILQIGQQNQTNVGSEFNSYIVAVEKCRGLDKIESLQERDDEALYTKVVSVITKYWEVEEDDDQKGVYGKQF